jgi:Zn-dependent protease with chaperone function
VILKLTVLLGVACLADLALRRAPAALRHLVWTLALACAILLPAGALYVPRVAGPAFVIHTTAVSVPMTIPARFNWVLGVYAFGAAILLARFVLDVLAANRIVREARPTSLPGVLVSHRAVVPFAWGQIVIPAGLEDSAAVIAHESAHIERGDVWTGLLAQFACAVYWFHPLVWWASARLRLEADRACDDAVLRRGFAGTGYADHLVRIARTLQSSTLAPGAVQRSQLEIRLRHILSERVDRRRLGAWATGVTFLASIAIVLPLAAVTQAEPTIYKLTTGITPPKVVYKVDPRYTLRARKGKIQGPVILSIVVGSDGRARDIRVKKSLDEGLDESAMAAVKQWKFQPAARAGQAVNVRATVEVVYRLK